MPTIENAPPGAAGFFRNLVRALTSWRTASVALLSFSSGLPLGLVWFAIPDWMRDHGVDIRIVGLLTLAQAPWSFKILWSPLMDRWRPPFFGRRRGWAALAQIALLVLTISLAGLGNEPDAPWIVFALTLAIAFASATQDIAVDAYAVDVLHEDEQGVAVGARTALYRAAMFLAGAFAITLTGMYSWRLVCVGLGLLYVPMLLVTWKAPEPPVPKGSPTTLREAVWLPFLGFLSRHRALEILAFVILYKLADNLAQSLLRPFLVDMGYDAVDRGIRLGILGTTFTLVGTFLGGALTHVLGLGRALWVFGGFQIFSNLGYILVAQSPVNRPLMFGAMAFETFSTGLGTGAFMVLLLRMTQKRFSATQYALFSSLFGLPRILAGPITGYLVDAVGWTVFFWVTILAGLPGLAMLARFVPWRVREPEFVVEPPAAGPPITTAGLIRRGLLGGGVGVAIAAGAVVSLEVLKALREGVTPALAVVPDDAAGWVLRAGIVVCGLVSALFVAAVAAARHRGMAAGTEDDPG